MRIFDITELIKTNKINNYVFNNSLIHYEDNLFIMVYRNIIYNINEITHPWKFWNDSYKIMLKYNPEIVKKNQHLNVNLKLFNLNKYRNYLAKDHFVKLFKFKDNTIFNNDEKAIEFDSTGLCILEYINDQFIVKYNVNNIFDNNMNQDTRLYNFNNNIYLTYNSFITINNKLYVKMMKRKIEINLNDNYIFLYPESELLLIKHHIIEKNCILLENNDVLYNINKEFIYQNMKTKITKYSTILDNINNRYKNIFISFGTPVLKFNDNQYISVGHMKIEYKNNTTGAFSDNSYLNKFLKNIDLSQIKKHGKYIYFAFIFIFDHNYDIIYISDFFIPSIDNKDYLPYLLVFPTGLTYYNDKYYISYGEGDEKCKILELSKDEILNILKKYNQELIILKPEDLKPKILHLGYFNKWNCGDDCFVDVFNYLHSLTNTKNKYIIDYQDRGYIYKSIILGGGDVINPYFCNNILLNNNNIKKIGYGVGLPYLDQIHLLDKFDKIILRNSNDLIKLDNDKYIAQPDLVYLMMKYYKPLNILNKTNNYRIGISLPRTYFNKDYVDEYKSLIIELYKFIKLFKQFDEKQNLEIYLIPFCINNLSYTEDDNILNKQLFELLSDETNKVIKLDTITIKESNNIYLCYIDKHTNYYFDILNIINSMDFMICGRFHSHIFSIICNIPFISLSCSRKCSELMNEYNLNNYLYKMKTNDILIPNNLDHKDLYNWIKNINENELREKIIKIHNQIYYKLDDMINIWKDIYNYIEE